MPSRVSIRSPLLRPMEDWRDADTAAILRRRRALAAGIVALGAVFVLITRAGLLPAPALDALYVLHDYAALPIVGYTWTLFAPYSITWWSLTGIALGIWVVTFFTRWSAVRGPHARLARTVVVHLIADSSRSPRYVARLTAWVDWLAARTIGAELLKDVVRLEHADALTTCVAAGGPITDRAAWRLVRLTDLLTRLTSNAGAAAPERWRSLAIWHQTLMWIDRRAGTTGAAAAFFSTLAATGLFLLDRLDSVEGEEGEEGDELSNQLRRDLRWLVDYAADRAASSAEARSAKVDEAPSPDIDFMRSVLERLDALWILAERGSNDEGGSPLISRAPDGVIAAQGILVASIGLHAASRADDMHLAAAHLHAFEALRFVGFLGAGGRDGTRVARALAAQAPERDHYRLVADIAESRRASAFARRASAGRTVLDEAANHERTRIAALHDAAGPDFALASTASRSGPADGRSGPSVPRERDLRSRLRHRMRHRSLPLRMRVDPVLIGGLAAAAVVYCVATAMVVLLFGADYTARWSARALADRRLLENVRRGLETAPFLDAVFHAPDHQLVVSQRGGVFHSYDLDTGLWSTTRPFGPNDLSRPEIRLLASSSDGRSDALWGVTADGGLVRRLNGRWEVIVGDTKFIGRRGTAIQQSELSAIAASPDGKWLLAAAGADGVGLQDLERRRWLSRDEISSNGSPSSVTHAVWWRDRFYVGGPDGVFELFAGPSTPLGTNRPLAFRPVKGLEGAVVSLDATPTDGLYVYQTVSCENGPRTCVRVSRVSAPFSPPTTLVDERNRYTELSLERMYYVVQSKDHLLLAGGSGIFDYDVRLHSWKRHAGETISAVGPCTPSPCFYYGYGGRSSGVALFTPKTMGGEAPTRWTLPGEQPTRIAPAASGKAAVLTTGGRAYVLAAGPVSTLINPATSSPAPLDRYRDAVTFGDKVLFFGAPGALLHDIVRRSYSPLPAVPQWLRSTSSVVAASGAFLFGLESRGRSYDAHIVPQQQVELGTLVFNTSKPFPIDGPVRAVDASSPDVLRVVDGNGRVQSIAPSGVTPLTGGRSSAMARTRLLDVAASTDVLAASTVEGIRLYSMQSRSWSEPLPAPPGERAVEIAERRGTWLARTDANRLALVGAPPSTIIGGGEVMPRQLPGDAFQSGSEIYLSWPGTIQRYDTRSRQVGASWTFDAKEPTMLAGVIGSEPLSVAGGVARAGTREVARDVLRMFTSGSNVWLVREDGGQRYLETRTLASLAPQPANPTSMPACLFRTSNARAETNGLHDARRLSNGVIAVTTKSGLRLHSRDRHSWYALAGLAPDTGRATLATLGSTLLVWDGGESGGTLQIVRSPISLPDSCSTAAAELERPPDTVFARGVAIDEPGTKAYVLKDDGSVDRIEEAAATTMMGGESQGPPEDDVVRAWHFPDIAASVLWVGTRRGLWQYDLERHEWLEIALEYPAATRRVGAMSVDLVSSSGAIVVLATAGSERLQGTLAREPGRQRKIALVRASGPKPATDPAAQPPVFRIGAVTFFRHVTNGLLATLQTESGASTAAYRDGVFAWDHGRRGIAIGREGPLVLSDAGVHAAGSIASFSSFDPGPPGVASTADRLTSGPDLLPRMLRGNRWYRRVSAGVWEPASPPSTDAVLAKDDDVVWLRRNGSVLVESVSGAPILGAKNVHGLSLSTDQLIDAAAYGTGVALLTPGSIEFVDDVPSAALGTGRSTPLASAPQGATSTRTLLPAPPGDTLESATINGQHVMWLTRSGAVFMWNVERRTFEPAPASASPLEGRTLADSGPLRLTRAGVSIQGALRVADAKGGATWMPIDLSSGRFPFDVVRSVAVVGDVVYVGTDAGLQTYDGTDFSLENARLTVLPAVPSAAVATGASTALSAGPSTAVREAPSTALRARPSTALRGRPSTAFRQAPSAAVERVGESCDAPGTAVVCGPRGCAKQLTSAFVAVPGDALSCRLRARSPFWWWQIDAAGLSGRYVVMPVPGTPPGSAPVTLVDGQLSHDDIGQVVSFGGKTFTVWRSRYVGVHTTGLTLAGARNHAFALPVRLLRITAPVPMLRSRNRDLLPGLYAIEGPRTWRYGDERWIIVTDAAETETVAEYDAHPPLLQRQRLRLVRRDDRSAPAFEMRMPAGAWTPLAWDTASNRYALDVWHDIAVQRQTLWTATPAGLVSRDGDWLFNPDTFRVVDSPPQETGRTVTDLRVNGSTAEVRYEGERAYRIAIDAAASRPVVRLERAQDQFAEQTFDVDARYWTWRLTGRRGTSTGQLAGTFKGEPIAIVNGRFDFDTVNSLGVFQGLLHVATNTRGWFALPVDSAALENWSRPARVPVPPLDVARLYSNRDPDEPELCLQGLDGQFVRLSPSGVSRRTQGCPILAARTGFWRYTRDGSTLRVLPDAGATRAGERRLVDGRFSDEVITGIPVTGTNDRGSFTLVPTSAAVMSWDATGRVVDMYGPPFQGKPDVPRLLQWTAGGAPAYVADGTLYSLDNDDKPPGSWTVRLPPNAVFERLGSGPGPLLSIDWTLDGRRHHSVVDPRNNSVSHDEIPVDARKIPAYFRRAMTVSSYDGLIRLRLRDHIVSAYATSEGWPIVEADDSFQLLAGVSRGSRAILIGPRHLIELNMERIARAVYSGASPPAPRGTDNK